MTEVVGNMLIVLLIISVVVSLVFLTIYKPKPNEKETKVSKEFAFSQLIGQERFLNAYNVQLGCLAANPEFRAFVSQLRFELNGKEIVDTKTANKQIANCFYYNNANDRFSDVQRIAVQVKRYGTQASAHISIYYAMFLYDN